MLNYWSVDTAPRDEVYREPRRGKYREREAYQLGQSVSPLAYPSIALDVNYVFALGNQ